MVQSIELGGGAYREGMASFQSSSPLAELGITVSAGLIAVALGYLARYGRNSRNFLIAEACRWLADSWFRNFIVGTTLGSYFVFIHPALAENVAYAPLIEWAALAVVVWVIYRSIRSSLEQQCTIDPGFSFWKKHEQMVERKISLDFGNSVLDQQAFVELGKPDRLVAYLATVLKNGHWSQEKISEVMAPLIFHKRYRPPWYTVLLGRQYYRQRSRRGRRQALDEVLNAIAGTSRPAGTGTKEKEI